MEELARSVIHLVRNNYFWKTFSSSNEPFFTVNCYPLFAKDFENFHVAGSHHSAMAAAVAAASLHPDQDTDPRELEAFAERFKQRRIKLGKYILRRNQKFS